MSRVLLRRPSARFQAGFQAKLRGDILLPGLGSKRLAAIEAFAYRVEFCAGLGNVDELEPVLWQWERQAVGLAGDAVGAEAGPWPGGGAANEVCAERIAFDITQHSQKMVVLFDRKCFEPALPDSSLGGMDTVIAPDLAGQQPLHPTTQITIFSRP